jgi:hypothetical protein
LLCYSFAWSCRSSRFAAAVAPWSPFLESDEQQQQSTKLCSGNGNSSSSGNGTGPWSLNFLQSFRFSK